MTRFVLIVEGSYAVVLHIERPVTLHYYKRARIADHTYHKCVLRALSDRYRYFPPNMLPL